MYDQETVIFLFLVILALIVLLTIAVERIFYLEEQDEINVELVDDTCDN